MARAPDTEPRPSGCTGRQHPRQDPGSPLPLAAGSPRSTLCVPPSPSGQGTEGRLAPPALTSSPQSGLPSPWRCWLLLLRLFRALGIPEPSPPLLVQPSSRGLERGPLGGWAGTFQLRQAGRQWSGKGQAWWQPPRDGCMAHPGACSWAPAAATLARSGPASSSTCSRLPPPPRSPGFRLLCFPAFCVCSAHSSPARPPTSASLCFICDEEREAGRRSWSLTRGGLGGRARRVPSPRLCGEPWWGRQGAGRQGRLPVLRGPGADGASPPGHVHVARHVPWRSLKLRPSASEPRGLRLRAHGGRVSGQTGGGGDREGSGSEALEHGQDGSLSSAHFA